MKSLFSIIISLLLFTGCGNHFELNENVTGKTLTLINQDSLKVTYPDIIKNKITVIGFIYTHCPDICPLTTHNLQLTEEKLTPGELKNIKFLLVTFDPDRDSPSILKKYAEVRDMDMDHWELLTGKDNDIKALLDEYNVKAFPDDTTYNEKGEPEYFMIHTDRISLVDNEGNLRKNYRGSTAKPEEILTDIRNLE